MQFVGSVAMAPRMVTEIWSFKNWQIGPELWADGK
jgi:hypothetical protein